MSKFAYGQQVAAGDLSEGDAFCKKMNERKSFRIAEISDKIYYVDSGSRTNAKQVGYKFINKDKLVYFLRHTNDSI